MQSQRDETQPMGLVVRATPPVRSLSLWCGDRELVAELNSEQAAMVARALVAQSGVMQLVGYVRKFTVQQPQQGANHGR